MSTVSGKRIIFITGGTGYIGTRLIKRLLKRGHSVTALVRKGSEHKLPPGVTIRTGDPFDSSSFQAYIPKGAVFVQLLGVSHPSPKKAQQFKEIDARSVIASADAAKQADVDHFVYISVAMSPSKLMEAYQEVRKEGEQYCLDKKLVCSFIRPWYVLGPGHWWPILLLPLYGLAELVPAWRKKAREKGLVTINQMLNTLTHAVEISVTNTCIYEIKNIRNLK